MSRQSELAELSRVYDNSTLSNRNLVINGAMMIAQRSTSVSSQTGSGYKTVDRFRVNASGGTYNQSQQTVTVGGETGLPTEFTKFLRHECTSGNDNHLLMTRIEDVAKFQGNMVLTFYAKGSNPSTLGKLSVKFHQNFGSGGSSDVYTTVQDLTLTSTWQRFTFNVTMASISGKTVGNGNYGSFLVGQDTNASTDAWTLDITGVQLEVGDSATPFEHRSFGEELGKCMRYYYKSNYGATFTTGDLYFGRDTRVLQISFPTNMRANPSVTTCNDVSVGSGGGSGHYVVHGVNNYTDGANLHSTPNQFTMYTPNRSTSQPTKTGFIADAEL
tara:strand:- start:4961 stop:5947 length:987 start_codon:yes stop_codon:yes gene_type:complete